MTRILAVIAAILYAPFIALYFVGLIILTFTVNIIRSALGLEIFK